MLPQLIQLFPEGVTIDAQFSTIDGEEVSSVEVPNDLGLEENAPAYQTIQVGVQQMDGKALLNYARYRYDDEGDVWSNYNVSSRCCCQPSCHRQKIQ